MRKRASPRRCPPCVGDGGVVHPSAIDAEKPWPRVPKGSIRDLGWAVVGDGVEAHPCQICRELEEKEEKGEDKGAS